MVCLRCVNEWSKCMSLTESVHIGADDLPFVDIGDGSMLKVIQVKPEEGLWIVENIFKAACEDEAL